ncbi:NarK/NasA family nitrate transporter [Sanguibacter hominis ATCC BAA-789]|uniref:NarK/NasA family nitrate transporter n=1 Tax=Sanguibacter hominis ATCC BAA-789 TaxID=1312740 RepID=A0A9X5FE65_9MICO|nr:MFS transporter [Sanguibacter hominis]NKX93262.1 NarK/NasA family nitrate transporter [Sanguibacter hominis ATCC BAA-789]
MSRTTSKTPVDLSDWDPEDPERWDSRFAWRTLWITTYNLTLAFAVWFLVSAVAPRLNSIGYDLSDGQLYWLVAIPGLAGGFMRMIYMFLPPIVGTRTLVGGSATLLLLPMIGWTFAIRDPQTSYSVLVILAIMCGIGGGAFSGFMPSTSYFFPKRMSGTALGLQAGIGNFGVSLIQLLTPWVVGFGLLGTAALTPQSTADGEVWLHNAAIVLIPWCILGMILAAVYLRRVPITANFRQQLDIFREPHTWIMTLIYLMTFGAFSGFAGQLGLLIRAEWGGFADAPDPLKFAFLGPLLGSASRAAFGPLCDKFGGAVWTLVAGIGMTLSTAFCVFFLDPTSVGQFWWFLGGMLVMFTFAGIGNAGTFKQMPMIFPPRQAGGVIGWTASIAAFGPFVVGMGLSAVAPRTFFIGCTVFFALCTYLTWHFYARPGAPRPS